jgi:hypothetical protein
VTPPSQPSLPVAAPGAPADPTHACIRCGRPGVPVDAALCEQCNPLALAQPSATQVHGIAVVGIVVFVALLAVLGRAALVGTGPFNGTVLDVAAAAGGLEVTLVVHNAGTKAGATTCRITQDSRPAGGPGDLVQTPSVPAGGDARFTALVTKLGATPIGLAADCQSP